MKTSSNRSKTGNAERLRFALALVAVLGSCGLGCANKPAPVLPTVPPCPGYSWALLEEIELVCALGNEPFALCPHLYSYIEDVARYCEEVKALGED